VGGSADDDPFQADFVQWACSREADNVALPKPVCGEVAVAWLDWVGLYRIGLGRVGLDRELEMETIRNKRMRGPHLICYIFTETRPLASKTKDH
jgi:hypothetical protein